MQMAKILLRIDDKEKELLEALAKKNKRSINSELLVAISAYIKKNKEVNK